MTNATIEKPKPRPAPETITWGDPEEVGNSDALKTLRGWEFKYGSAPQSLPGYRVGSATDRSAQEGAIKAVLGDQSAGVKPRAGIGYWQSDALRSHVRNEGWQTRAGMPSLPYVQETQVGITSAADPSGYNAANKRRHELSSSLGGSVFRYYCGLGVNFVRNDNVGATKSAKSELETVSCNVDGAGASVTLPGVVTAIAHMQVNLSRVLALALEDYGVVYTSDPTASPVVFTTLVDLDSGDRIDGMAFMEELGPVGTNIFCGQIGGVNSAAWWADANMTASTTVKQVVNSVGATSLPSYTRSQSAWSSFASASSYHPDFGDLSTWTCLGWWALNESNSSNSLLDSSGNGRTLTGGNLPGIHVKGLAINNHRSRDFESGSSQAASVADAAWNSVTGDLEIYAWAQLESTGADRVILAKWFTTGDQRSYRLWYDNANSRFVFSVSSDGTSGAVTSVTANNFGAPSTATPYFIRAYHDATNNIISISVNGGTADTAAHSTNIFDSTASLVIGADNNGNYWDGRLDEVSVWSDISSSRAAILYNSGDGLSGEEVGGDGLWTTPSNAVTSDNAYAVSTALSSQAQRTPYLRLYTPTISGVPSGARILGVTVEISHFYTTGAISVYEVALGVSGSQVGVSRFPLQVVSSTTITTEQYLGTNDTCFATLTGADLANLEVWLRYINMGSAASGTVSIDRVRVRVDYSEDVPVKQVLTNQAVAGIDKDTSGTPNVYWANPNNAISFDQNVAVASMTAVGQLTDYLLLGPLAARGTLPSSATLLGLQIDLLGEQVTDPSLGIQDETVQLYSGGSLTGLNKAKDLLWGGRAAANTDPASAINASYGRDGDNWAIDGLSPDDLADIYLAVRLYDVASGAQAAWLDGARWHVSYVVPGAAPSLPIGGWCAGVSQDESNTLYRAVPPVDEPDTVVQPRSVRKLVFSWDTAGARPLLTLTRVSTGMTHVEHFNYALGGILATGDHAGGPGRHLHLISRTGAVYDQNFAGVHGTAEVRVNAIAHVQGLHSILDVVDSDYSNRQFWTLRDQTFFADWIMQSKSQRTITERPIACAETAIDLENDRMYSLFPKSSGLAASRVFCQRDLNADPRLTSTDEVRSMAWSGSDGSRTEDTGLYLYMGIIDFGPPEASKAVTMVSHHSYRVDDGTTYGTSKFEATIDGSVPDGSDSFDLTFAAGLSDQTNYAYDQAIAGSQDYRSLYIRLGGTHTAASAKSPDLGPFLMTTNQMWLDDELIHIIVDRSHLNEADSEFQGFDDWREFAWKKPTRTLSYSGRQVLAQWVGWREGDAWASLPALGTSPGDGPPLIAVWRRVPGEVDPAA